MTQNPSLPPDANELLLPLPRLAGAARARRAAATRAPASHGLPLEQVSNILWAGFGLSCHGSGGRAAGGRRGPRAVEVYVCLPGGCYRYDAGDHALVLVTPREAPGWTGSGGLAPGPAVAFIYVTDGVDEADTWEETGQIAGSDMATIARNVAAHSTAAGLVVRADEWFQPQLPGLLGLHPGQTIALTQTVSALPTPTH